MKKNIAIVTVKKWNIDNAKAFARAHAGRCNVLLITDKRKLTHRALKRFNPEYVFFPHWSWIIPPDIYTDFKCVVFHMTDLPFGRGGSPLQNLIARGLKKTKISAIRVDDGIDSGPVYMKKGLGLDGKASEIFVRASNIIFCDMMPFIINKEPDPVPQRGRVVKFKRRTPSESNLAGIRTPVKLYNHIRMLDAEGYPAAFVEASGFKIEFYDAELGPKGVIAKARITKK